MRAGIAVAGITVGACCVWVVLVAAGHLYGWGRTALAPAGEPLAFLAAASAQLDDRSPGAAALLLLDAGEVVGSYFVSKAGAVDGNSRFQVASLSKWLTAYGVMTLVQAGHIDLDAPVAAYLTRWRLPAGRYPLETVTVRRLLSHTGGLTDGLGFAGYGPGEPVPGLVEALTAPKASSGQPVTLSLELMPGTQFEYSGGGYLLLQLVVEEVSGRPFADYMRTAVFEPLAMYNTDYAGADGLLEGPDLVPSWTTAGQVVPHFRFAAIGASGLRTTALDLARFVMAQAGAGVLDATTLAQMRTPAAEQMGIPIWALGTILYAPTPGGAYVVGHDGNDDPAINTTARFNPDNNAGIVVLTTGGRGLAATDIGGEWVFWQTGAVDLFTITRALPRMIATAVAGVAVLIGAGFAIGLLLWWRGRRGAARSA